MKWVYYKVNTNDHMGLAVSFSAFWYICFLTNFGKYIKGWVGVWSCHFFPGKQPYLQSKKSEFACTLKKYSNPLVLAYDYCLMACWERNVSLSDTKARLCNKDIHTMKPQLFSQCVVFISISANTQSTCPRTFNKQKLQSLNI